jgi:esterase/lipase superfamily enzyme
MTSTRSWWLPALLLATSLAACTARPGPELLNPTSSPPSTRVVAVYVATTRARQRRDSNVFTNDHSRELNYAAFKIAIPSVHRIGHIE